MSKTETTLASQVERQLIRAGHHPERVRAMVAAHLSGVVAAYPGASLRKLAEATLYWAA